MTVQYIEIDEIPYIAPEAIRWQYQAISILPDATPELTAIRMVRWAESCVRVGMSEREERIKELGKALRTIASYLPESEQP